MRQNHAEGEGHEAMFKQGRSGAGTHTASRLAWEQVNGGAAMDEEDRRLYAEEINPAVREAKPVRQDQSFSTRVPPAPKSSFTPS
jgi:hypothetical protein